MARRRRNTPRSNAARELKVFPTAAKAGLAPGTLKYVGRHEAEESYATLIEYGPRAGDYQETRFTDPEQGRQYQPRFQTLWLNLHGLGNLDLLTVVGERFGLHPLVMEDILNTEHRPGIYKQVRINGHGIAPLNSSPLRIPTCPCVFDV